MSWTPEARWTATISSLFVASCIAVAALGHALGDHVLEAVGFLLLAGTFVPLPFDVYVLHVVPRFGLWPLVLLATLLNTLAVLAERWFVVRLLQHGRGRHVVETVRGTPLSRWFGKAPFLWLFVGGFTIVPFEPVRFLGIANGYPVVRYGAATFLGRGVRFYVLVTIGGILVGWGWLSTVLLILLLLYFVGLMDRRTHRKIGAMFGSSGPPEGAKEGRAEPGQGRDRGRDR